VRSYGQYCALARALDVIGDRWSLLIVRELLGGGRRYNQLLEGLPGIATNLLADRLRQLETEGVLERDNEGRYALTAWGEGLREPLYDLARWAAPVVMARPAGEDSFRSEWLEHPIAIIYGGTDRRRPTMAVEVRSGERPMTIESSDGDIRVREGRHPAPDVVLSGPPDAILGLLAGFLDPALAEALGVEISGKAGRLRRLRPVLAHPSRSLDAATRAAARPKASAPR